MSTNTISPANTLIAAAREFGKVVQEGPLNLELCALTELVKISKRGMSIELGYDDFYTDPEALIRRVCLELDVCELVANRGLDVWHKMIGSPCGGNWMDRHAAQ